jgi:thioredoxin 1
MEMRDYTQDSLGSKSTHDKHSVNIGLRFSKKVQGAIIALIVILIASVTMMGCITNSSKPSNSVSDPNRLYSPLEMTDDSVASALNNSSFFVLDFYYPGCGPCKIMNNTTSQLSNELQGQIGFGRMNVRERENSQTVKKYKVSSYPTLLLFDEGVLVNRMKGNTSKSDLLAELKDLKPGLDTSKVMLQTDAAPSSGDIALAKLGEAKPTEPMLITDSNIDSAVKKYPYLVIDGFTTWCEHCKPSNVTLEQLSSELQGQVAFGLINIDKNRATKVKYNITSYPTLLIFKDGELAEKRIGTPPKSILVSELKKHYPDLNTSKVNLTQPRSTAQAQAAAKPKLTPEQVCINMTKSDQPLLQAFVVARCPFGLQMQRIMADIISESKETEKYLIVRYIGSVDEENNTIKAMHGDVEAQENLRQICIREEQPDKYWDYVRCYMREGKTADCLESVAVDVDELDSCTNDTSRGLVYSQEDFDLASKFKVTGSPTMLMNDQIVKESDFATNITNGRSPEAVKDLLCCGFTEEPSFCSRELNESRAATMFSAN